MVSDYTRTVTATSAALYFVAATIALVAVNLPGMRQSVMLLPAIALAAVGYPAALATYLVPWHRLPPNLFLTVGTAASLHIALFLWATGGSASPFWSFAVFIALGGGAYFRDRWPVVVLALLAVAVIASPLLYEHPAPATLPGYLVARSTTVFVSFLATRWLFHQMETSLTRAARLRETRTQFLFALGHQLRTPVSALRLALDVLGDKALAPSDLARQRAVAAADRSARRIERQVQRLLDLFRLQQGDGDLAIQEVSLAEMASGAAEAVQPQAVAKGLSIVLAVPSLELRADPTYMEEALTNLLQNAVEFTPPGGRIVVSAQDTGGAAEVRVRDSGPGIPRSERRAVLEGGFLPGNAPLADQRGQGSGSGLGLALARAIVERHGGRMWVEDAPEGGAALCLSLPLPSQGPQATGGGQPSGPVRRLRAWHGWARTRER